MPRRIIMIHLRKYLIVFFAVVLIIVWFQHYNDMDRKDMSYTTASLNTELRYMTRIHEVSSEKPVSKKHFDRSRLLEKLERYMKGLNTYVPKEDFMWEPTEDSTSSVKPARYFVNSQKCKMPYADPFSQEVLEIYSPSKIKVCSNESSLFELSYDVIAGSYKLDVQKKVLKQLRPHGNVRYKCNYRAVFRGINSSGNQQIKLTARVYFKNSCTLPRNITGIIVECHDAHKATNIIQQDAFPLVQVPNNSVRLESKPTNRQPSVILIGLDSMSRMNFRRTMPQTMEFVNEAGWFEMEGYNKVADNTLNNMIPVLTGYTEEKLLKLAIDCSTNTTICDKAIGQLPWIWSDFKNAGYVTALAEDNFSSIFSESLEELEKNSFNHYLRTLMLSINNTMRSYMRYGYQYCLGRRLSVGYVFDFCQQFLERYVKELNQPVFGFFWSCTFTHDFYYGASSLDGKLTEYFKTWQAQSLFDRAIVILFSDHGARFGDLMELSDSFLEERLPMLHIYLPPWFRDTYPQYAQALYANRNRLCSNYDLYSTLQHILQLNATLPAQLPPTGNCPSGQSLLHALPQERSCPEACIDEHWCTCNEYISQTLNGEMYYIGKLLVFHINRWMLVNKFNKDCQRILLFDMDSAEKKLLLEENGEASMYGTIVTYRIGFRTYPGKGKFRTTIRFNKDLKTIENFSVPRISRLSSYHNESLCLKDKIGKKFCVCYPNEDLSEYDYNWQNLKLTTLQT